MKSADMTVRRGRRRGENGFIQAIVLSLVISLVLHVLLVLSLGNVHFAAPMAVKTAVASVEEEVRDWFTLLPLEEKKVVEEREAGEQGRRSTHERRTHVTDSNLQAETIRLDDIPQPPVEIQTSEIKPEEIKITADELGDALVKTVTIAGVDTGTTTAELPEITVSPEVLPEVSLPELDLTETALSEPPAPSTSSVSLPAAATEAAVLSQLKSEVSAPVMLPAEAMTNWRVSFTEDEAGRRGVASGVPQLSDEAFGRPSQMVRAGAGGQAGRVAGVRGGRGGSGHAQVPIRIRLGLAPEVASPEMEQDGQTEVFTMQPPALGDDGDLLAQMREREGGLPFEKSVPLDEFVNVKVRIQRDASGGGYYQVLLGANVNSDALSDVPKDVLFVIDHSGSIRGARLSQFKAMTRQALGQLNAADRFNVVSFTSRARPLFETFVSPTPEHLAQAQKRIQGLVSSGTTDVFGGVGPFVRKGNDDAQRPIIVFLLTDGQSTIARHRGEIQVDNENTSEVLRTIATLNPGNVSIYPFSAGENADRVLLDFMARLNCGLPYHALRGDSFRNELGTYLRTHLGLLVRNFRYIAEGELAEDLYPRTLPHLYRHEAMAIYGRFKPGDDAVVLTLLGYDAQGKLRNISFKRRFAECEEIPQDALEGGVTLKEQWLAQKTLHLLAEWVVASDKAKGGQVTPEMRRRRAELNRLLASMTAFTKYSNLLQ